MAITNTESKGINLKFLDNMVLSHMSSEGLTEESSCLENLKESKRKCLLVYKLLASGELDNACKLINDIDSDILKDKRIDFKIKKQYLIEMIHNESDKDIEKKALEWIRKNLAPIAHDAYPEAYNEFKKVLLFLFYQDKNVKEIISSDWAEDSREFLAEMVYSNLRYRTGVKDSDLVNLLKYLIQIHYRLKSEVSIISNTDAVIEKLRCQSKYPSPLKLDTASTQIFPDKDIQALMQSLDISKDEAIEALKRSAGDVSSAFEGELGTFKINMKELNNLALEYAGYRNLLQLSESDSDDGDLKEVMSEGDLTDISDLQEICDLPMMNYLVDTGNNLIASNHDLKKSASESDKLEVPVRTVRKTPYKCDANLKLVLKILKMVRDGKYVKTIDMIKQIDSSVFTKHPNLIFELWKFEVLRVSRNGNHDNALELIKKNLTPIVKQHKEFLPSLKDTLSMIMTSKNDQPSVSEFCCIFQEALQESLNLPGTQLTTVITTLLESHLTWFSRQKYQDIFTKNLGIDMLYRENSLETLFSIANDTATNRYVNNLTYNEDSNFNFESNPTVISGDSDVIGDIPDEFLVEHLMEILSLPRAHAVDLLIQYEGSIEAVFMNIMN